MCLCIYIFLCAECLDIKVRKINQLGIFIKTSEEELVKSEAFTSFYFPTQFHKKMLQDCVFGNHIWQMFSLEGYSHEI